MLLGKTQWQLSILLGILHIGELLEEQENDCVGAAISSGIDNTNKLKVLGYEKVMATNRENSEAHTKGTTGNRMMGKPLCWVPC